MMKRFFWHGEAAITEMSKLIEGRGVSLGASEKVFSLPALATVLRKKRLDEIKGRQVKPYLFLARSIEVVKKRVDLN